jgi:hypothetical protein
MRNAPTFGFLRRAAFGAALAIGMAGPAQAYIDPGTGSMLLQVIGAGIAGAIFYFRELRIKVMSFFSRREASAVDDVSEPPPGDSQR